jgi:glycosyltransferase involved in cell wall biosynthesis
LTGASPGAVISVLHVTEPVDGGAAQCVVAYARDQAERGWDVTVLSPPDAMFVRAVEAVGARTSALQFEPKPADRRPTRPHVGDVARGIRTIRACVRERSPDVVHLHSSWAGLVGRLALRGRTRTLFQPHGWSFDAVGPRLASAARAWERVGAAWTTGLVCVSDGERRRGTAAGVSCATHVVPNGVDVGRWRAPSPEERVAARALLRVDEGDRMAVCVGRFAPVKGQAVLLAAWPQVIEALPDALLLLAGDGPDRASLQALDVPRVVFAGAVADLASVYAAADVVVIASRSEGMSITMLEAMACGRCVVSTDVGGAAEALGDDSGAVVPVDDTDALAAEVALRLGDPERARAEGRSARRRAETTFDVRRTAAALANVYLQYV